MAKLSLNIIADIKDVEEKVASIKTKLTEIGSNPIKIRVDASGLDAISQKIKVVTDAEIRAAEAAAKLANAEARKINAETRAAESAAKLARAQKKAAKAAAQAASAQEGFSTSTALVIKNVGTLEAKITSLTRAYNQLAEAQRRLSSGNSTSGYLGNGGGGGMTNGSERNALPSPGALVPSGSRTIEWSRYGDYRDSAINVDWTPVVDGANAATDAVNRAGNAASGATGGFKRLADMIKTAGQHSEGLVGTLHQYIEWYLRWTVVSGAFQAAVGSIKEALQTMKAVDDELVTVRKVTGFTADEMKRVEEQAYKTASAYGVAANEYLKSVAAFARAGYKEQSEALAELSTKTQIVGDTTAEVANQFLISVDAAYKYKGSVEELTKVLDGANELDNKYATSIEKIAEGMGIVAPVAAQMNVSIDELAAAIGTVTAVTQRSGSEAARALRALFLNIAGDTKTEIDEGVTWTTGEIEGLRDVIKQFSKDAYDAAQATGSIIDPMRAMEGLAKSMQEGLLTEQKLIEMVSDIGGKLRTSQLLAIIQNWDMYQSMLQDYAGAIGSADREVENALDSWSRKTEQLKNAWTEFISHVVETKDIKNAVDLLTDAVKFLDTSLGQAVVKVGLLFAALKVTGVISGLTTLISGLITTITGLTTATELFSAVWATSPFMVVAIGAAAIYGIVKAVDALSVSFEEQQEILEDLNKQYDKQFGSGSEYDNLTKKADDLTVSERERLIILRGQEEALKGQVEEAKKLAAEKWLNENSRNTQWTSNYTEGGDVYYDTVKTSAQNLRELTTEVDKASDAYFNLEAGIERYTDSLGKAIAPFKDYYDGLVNAKNAGMELNEEEEEFIRVYENAASAIGRANTATEDDTKAKNDNKNATNQAAQANETLKKAFEGVEGKSSLTYGTLEDLDRLYPGLSKKILDVNGNLTAEGQAALASKNAFVELIAQEYIFNNTSLDVSGKISALYELASAAGLAGNMLAGIANPGEAENAIDYAMSMGLSREQAEKSVMSGYQQRFIKGLQDQTTITPPPGGTGGGTVETAEEKEKKQQQEHLKGLQQIVADEKARYTLMEAQGATQEELAAQAKVIQDALHNQAEYMRDIKEPYASIAALSKEWFDWQKKIEEGAQKAADAEAKAAEAKRKAIEDAHKSELDARKQAVTDAKVEYDLMKAQGASREELAAKAKEIQGLLHNEAEYMRQVNSESGETVYTYAEIATLSEEWWDWQEKINDSIAETAAEAERVRQQQVDDAADHVSLLKQQLAFLKASGASDDEIIAKYKEIQAALHEQAEAMRQTEAYLREDEDAVAAVLALSTEWWDVQSQIQGVLDKTAETLKKEIKETIDDIVGQLQEQNDAQVAALQAEIDLMKEQHDAAEDTREEEEKRLAVEKARLDLENAQRERTVRQYNASTGQWEWVANAKNVQAAQEELAKSEAALNAYLAEQDYKKKIAELEAQKEETKSVFQTVKDAMNKFAEAVGKILESPKLDANAKTKFADDIEAILKAPTLKQDVKDNFIAAVTHILEVPYWDETTKTEFVAGIKDILLSPTLPDDVKTKFLDGVESILSIDALPATTKKDFIDGVTEILKSPTLPADVKDKFIDDITNILKAPKLTDKAKQTILNNLASLLNNTGIKDDVKVKISSAIAALVGNSKDANSAVALFNNYITTAIKNAKDPEKAINDLVDKIIAGGGKFQSVDELLKNVEDETNKLLLMAQMKTNSMLWWMYDDGDNVYSDEQKALAAENQKIGKALGFTYDSSKGQWYKDKKKTQPVYTIDSTTKDSIKGALLNANPEAFTTLFQALADELAAAIADVDINVDVDVDVTAAGSSATAKKEVSYVPKSQLPTSDTGSNLPGTNKDSTKPKLPSLRDSLGLVNPIGTGIGASIRDSGGMLHGMGGIKATTEDEMVIPPTLTKAMLNAEKDGAFKALMKDLGIVTAASSQIAGYGGGQAPSSIGEQNNGDSYNFGNISLSEQQAKGMTVYDLAQLGRTLALQRGN